MAMKTKELKYFRFKANAESIDEEGHFTGYASIFGVVDSYGDIVDFGAFKKTLKERERFKLLWSHDAWVPAIGYIELEEDKKGLRVASGQLYLELQRAREAYVNMKNGTLDGLSIGYNVLKETIDRATNERHLKEIELWEVSLCNFQACPGAVVTDVKSRMARIAAELGDLDPQSITDEEKLAFLRNLESHLALGKTEPPAGTPKNEPPADSGLIEAVKSANSEFARLLQSEV
jgi:hypothetical protein